MKVEEIVEAVPETTQDETTKDTDVKRRTRRVIDRESILRILMLFSKPDDEVQGLRSSDTKSRKQQVLNFSEAQAKLLNTS